MSSSCCTHSIQNRRAFIKTAVLAGSAGILAMAFPLGSARAAGETEALLLSCMDFRLVDDTEQHMASKGLRDRYDHVILAGAALGAVTDKYPAWNRTFWEHLDVAIQLHHIKRVVIMDHRDCGAYKVILGEDFALDPVKEKTVHTQKLRELKTAILAKHPELAVEMALMDLRGKVEIIT